jgi:hypothetical protein
MWKKKGLYVKQIRTNNKRGKWDQMRLAFRKEENNLSPLFSLSLPCSSLPRALLLYLYCSGTGI